MELFTVKSPTLEVAVEKENGRITSMYSPRLAHAFLDRAHLGGNFVLHVPIGDNRCNFVDGARQKLRFASVKDGVLTLRWDKLESETAGILDISVEMTISAKGDGLLFACKVENNSPYTVESVAAPFIGDIRRPSGTQRVDVRFPGYSDLESFGLYPYFQNLKGYWGVREPTVMPSGPAGIVWPYAYFDFDEKKGLYFSPAAETDQYLSFCCRLKPGYAISMDSRNPQGDFVDGKEVSMQFDIPHLVFVESGGTRDLTPVYMQAFEGSWRSAADIYKGLSAGWGRTTPAFPKWSTEPHAWLQLQVNSSEDSLLMPFSKLPEVAKQCAEAGITVIQLVGWNKGGQDRNNPSHDVENRLGSYEDFKAAIAECHKLGVRIVLFVKFTWADTTTDWYRDELNRYTIRDMNGQEYKHPGYQYYTPTQLQDLNTRRFAPLCFLDKRVMKALEKQFEKIAGLGADGILYDECQHKFGAHMCFDESHGHKAGALSYQNDNKLIKMFSRMTDGDYLFCGEGNYDRQNEVYHLQYFRSFSRFHLPVKKYINQKTLFMTAVTGFDDREMINQCLLYNYIPSYEPYNFKGTPRDMQKTLSYGAMMMQLRRETREYVWDAQMLYDEGVCVKVGGKPHSRQFCSYRSTSGKLSVVIVNLSEEAIVPEICFEDGRTVGRWRAVDGHWQAGPDVVVPARGAVVAIEE